MLIPFPFSVFEKRGHVVVVVVVAGRSRLGHGLCSEESTTRTVVVLGFGVASSQLNT